MTLRVIFAGTPQFAVPTLDALCKSLHDVIAVYTQPDRPAGRGRKLKASPVKQIALEKHIPVFQPEALNQEAHWRPLQTLHADVMVVVAYGIILPPPVLSAARLGCINVHASLLPRWRGAAPIQRAIAAGDQETGISIMQLDKGLDTGPVFMKVSCPIEKTESSHDLHDRLSMMGANALLQTLDRIEKGDIYPTVQDNKQATYAKKIEKQEACIDWELSAQEIANRIRAFNPWPVAYTHFGDQVLKVWKAVAISTETTLAAGTVVDMTPQHLEVATGEGVLRLLTLQLPGGRPISIVDFINGHQQALVVGATQFI